MLLWLIPIEYKPENGEYKANTFKIKRLMNLFLMYRCVGRTLEVGWNDQIGAV
jgi:hypothetical protein